MQAGASLLRVIITAALVSLALACTPTPTAQPPAGPSSSGEQPTPDNPLLVGIPDAFNQDSGEEAAAEDDTGQNSTGAGTAQDTGGTCKAEGENCGGNDECCSEECFLGTCEPEP